MTTLFISYSRADKETIDSLVEALQKLGLQVWIDTSGIKGGREWQLQITKAIRECDFFLLCMSSASVKSDNVRREIDIAFSTKKPIIPLRLEEVDYPQEWLYQVASIQWIEYDKGWELRLLEALGQPRELPSEALKSTKKNTKRKKETPWYNGLINLKTGVGAAFVITAVLLILTNRLVLKKISSLGFEAEVAQPSQAITMETTATLSGTGESPQSGSDILRVTADLSDFCLIAGLFPDEVDPGADPVKAYEEFNRQFQDGRTDAWVKVPAKDDEMIVKVSALPGNRSWAKTGNQAQVSISVNRDIPEHVNIIQSCAGGGEVREFEPIMLEAENISAYSLKVTYPGADFFTLQPGEFEELGFLFRCQSPGLYQLNIEIPYEYETDKGLLRLLSHTLLCPKTFTEWSGLAGPPMISMGKYEWNGNEYVEASN